MFLCMDEYGNVYQAASHRSDGRGVESVPHLADDFRDNTLDSSFKKHEMKNQAEHRALKAFNEKQDQASEIAREKRRKHEAVTRAKQNAMNEKAVDRKNQEKLVREAKEKNIGGLADFDRLRIVDANYSQKHDAALSYLGEMSKEQVSPSLYTEDHYVMPYSGSSYDEKKLEVEANIMRRNDSLNKEWAEYQSVYPEASHQVDLKDGAQEKEMTHTSVDEEVKAEKKSKAPLIIGGLIIAGLFMGG